MSTLEYRVSLPRGRSWTATLILCYLALTHRAVSEPVPQSDLKTAINSLTVSDVHATYGRVSDWDTTSVTSISSLFRENAVFNYPISQWDTSRVAYMAKSYEGASAFNSPLSEWDTSKVQQLQQAFMDSVFNQPIGGWDVSRVNSLKELFCRSLFNQPIGAWDVSKVTTMYWTFASSNTFIISDTFNQPLNAWDVSRVTTMSWTFTYSDTFNQPLNAWDVSRVVTLERLFYRSPFNQPIGAWDVSRVTTMSWTFAYSDTFNQPLNAWDVSSLKNGEYAFGLLKVFNQPLNNWDVSKLEKVDYMLYDLPHFNQSLANWDVSSVTSFRAFVNRYFNGEVDPLRDQVGKFCGPAWINHRTNQVDSFFNIARLVPETSCCPNTGTAPGASEHVPGHPNCLHPCDYFDGSLAHASSATCACGNTVCSGEQLICDENANACSNTPSCSNSQGLVKNPVNTACQCGQMACEQSVGHYCVQSASVCNKDPVCSVTDGGLNEGLASCICTSSSDSSIATVCTAEGNGMYCTSTTGHCGCPPGKFARNVNGVCRLCPPGYYEDESSVAGACKSCASGTYSVKEGQTSSNTCQDCPIGRYGPFTGQSSLEVGCHVCPSGRFSNSTGISSSEECPVCPAGKYYEYNASDPKQHGRFHYGADCWSCPQNTFLGDPGNSADAHDAVTRCIKCTDGKFSDPGASTCNMCPAGKHLTEDMSSCRNCVAGRYQDVPGQYSCIDCPVGRYQHEASQAYCSKNPPGSYLISNKAGNNKSMPCMKGHFCQGGEHPPQKCPPGSYQGNTESISCIECPPGKYSNNFSSEICKLCPQDTFVMESNQTSCKSCSHHSTTYAEGAVFCMGCMPGQYMDYQSSSTKQCRNCTDGTVSMYQSSSCDICKSGTWASPERTFCIPCGAGKHGNNVSGAADNASACHACPPGKYSSFEGIADVSRCNSCAGGKYSAEVGLTSSKGCSGCLPGFVSNEGDSVCHPCEPGKYQSDTIHTSCISCTPGMFTSTDGSTNCNECPQGYMSNSMAEVCKACTVGFYQEHEGSTACATCVPGQFTNVSGGVKCYKCRLGMFLSSPGKHSSLCQSCPIGMYQNALGSAFCLPCEPGKYGGSANMHECNYCPTGQYRGPESKDRSICRKCEVGRFTLTEGATFCNACDIGQYGNMPGECSKCPGGYFQDRREQQGCQKCPIGKVSNLNHGNSEGSTFCEIPPWKTVDSCEKGQYLHDDHQNKSDWKCLPCMDGADCSSRVSIDGLRPKKGFFMVSTPSIGLKQMFIECVHASDCSWNETANSSCSVNRVGILCSRCKSSYIRRGTQCVICESDQVLRGTSVIFALVLIIVCGLWYLRHLIKRYHHKITAAWRDMMMVFKIMVNFTQVNLALPSMLAGLNWTLPDIYSNFLSYIGIAQLDLIRVIGFQCIVEVDFRDSLKVAFMIPVTVTVICAIGLLHARLRESRMKIKDLSKEQQQNRLSQLFDLADFDGNGELNVSEMQHLIDEVTPRSKGQWIKREEMSRMLIQAGGETTVVNASALNTDKNDENQHEWTNDVIIKRDAFLKAIAIQPKVKTTLAGNFPCDHAIHYLNRYKLRTVWFSGGVQVLLVFHAPVSAKAFLYFDCHKVGAKSYLRSDYSLECWSENWRSALPFALVLLFCFTLAIPFFLGMYMYTHRHHIQSPKVRQQVGFLMSRYNVGVEWWEIVELVRKLILTGVLIYCPAYGRTTTAVLVCIVSIAMLNRYEPQRTRSIFWVCQGSYFITTLKYLATTFDLSGDDQTNTLGYIMIAADLLVYVVGTLCIVLVFNTWVVAGRGKAKSKKASVQDAQITPKPRPISSRKSSKFYVHVGRVQIESKLNKIESEADNALKHHRMIINKRQLAYQDRLKIRLQQRKQGAKKIASTKAHSSK